MTARVPDAYFDRMYAESADPWQLAGRWYEQRKYAITHGAAALRRATGTRSNPAARSACSPNC